MEDKNGWRSENGERAIRPSSRKKRCQRLVVLLGVALLAVTVAAISVWKPTPTDAQTVTLPTFTQAVPLCSEQALGYYRGEVPLEEAVQGGEPYRPLSFEYTLDGQDGTLWLSEAETLTEASAFVLSAEEESLTLHNLKTDTTYDYRVEVNGKTYDGSFRTAAGTRFVFLDGIRNTRDIGGLNTVDGRTVKQGMIIRGTELDGLVNPSYYATAEVLEEAKQRFGFVYDFDLREPTVAISAYRSRFEGAGHRFYNAPMYANVFNAGYKDSLKAMFTDLADESHYPMYMHCTYGLDRTGTLVYLLLGVLGVPEEMLLREYYTSCYEFEEYVDNRLIESVYDGLQAYPGATLQEKIEAFLTKDIGVTAQQIERLRGILLETR